jgi:hypothetical protein
MMSWIRFVQKKWKFAVMTCGLIAVTMGCIGEDTPADGVPDNLTLTFRVETGITGEADIDLARTLTSMNVLLFDSEGLFVELKRVERTDPAIFSDVYFTVTPGKYRILVWGNVLSDKLLSTLVPGKSRMEDSYIEIAGTGDSLYYAPAKTNIYKGEAALRAEETDDDDDLYTVTMPEGGEKVVKELSFTRAYRTINLYLKGVESLGGSAEDIGKIQAKAFRLHYRYDFLFRTVETAHRDETRTFTTAATPGGTTLPVTRFHAAYGPLKEISFSILNLPGDMDPVDISLQDYLTQDLPSNLDDMDIMVELEKLGSGKVNVSVTMPNWSTHPVIPGY